MIIYPTGHTRRILPTLIDSFGLDGDLAPLDGGMLDRNLGLFHASAKGSNGVG